jgi:hypothetical protein
VPYVVIGRSIYALRVCRFRSLLVGRPTRESSSPRLPLKAAFIPLAPPERHHARRATLTGAIPLFPALPPLFGKSRSLFLVPLTVAALGDSRADIKA